MHVCACVAPPHIPPSPCSEAYGYESWLLGPERGARGLVAEALELLRWVVGAVWWVRAALALGGRRVGILVAAARNILDNPCSDCLPAFAEVPWTHRQMQCKRSCCQRQKVPWQAWWCKMAVEQTLPASKPNG